MRCPGRSRPTRASRTFFRMPSCTNSDSTTMSACRACCSASRSTRRTRWPGVSSIPERRQLSSRDHTRKADRPVPDRPDPPTAAVRAVLFDVDFTLIYPGPVFQGEGYRDFCRRHHIEVDPERFTSAVVSASFVLDDPEGSPYDAAIFVAYTRHIIEQMGGAGSDARLDA